MRDKPTGRESDDDVESEEIDFSDLLSTHERER